MWLYANCMTDRTYLPFYQWWNNRSRCSCWSKQNTFTKHFINLSDCCISDVLYYCIFLRPQLWKKNHKPPAKHQRVRCKFSMLFFMPIYKNKQISFPFERGNCLYINFKWKKKSHNFPVSKPTFQVLVHLFPFNISKLCSFGNISFKKCCNCKEMQWLIKMKTGIEGFVWWLPIVHRSLLGFLSDLKLLISCAPSARSQHPL